jgi:hypothetical protein
VSDLDSTVWHLLPDSSCHVRWTSLPATKSRMPFLSVRLAFSATDRKCVTAGTTWFSDGIYRLQPDGGADSVINVEDDHEEVERFYARACLALPDQDADGPEPG